MLNRIPPKRAVHAWFTKFMTNALDASVIWQAVNIALDTVEEQLASSTALTDVAWVLRRGETLISAHKTRGRARGARRRWADKHDVPLRTITIHPIPVEE